MKRRTAMTRDDYISPEEAAQSMGITPRQFRCLEAFGAISVHTVCSDGGVHQYVSRHEAASRNPYSVGLLLEAIRMMAGEQTARAGEIFFESRRVCGKETDAQ